MSKWSRWRSASPEERFWSYVEQTAECWLWLGDKNDSGYGKFWDGTRQVRAHRYAYQLMVGDLPPRIDHRCHNRACVNPNHLRPVSNKENAENLPKAHRDSQSGVRGVSLHKQSGKWRATVGHHGKQHHLGLFTSLEEAEAAVVAKRNELFTHNDMDRTA